VKQTGVMSKTLRQQYNEILTRYMTAEVYIDSTERTEKEIDKWMPEFLKIVAQINLLLAQIGTHTAEEAINGFK